MDMRLAAFVNDCKGDVIGLLPFADFFRQRGVLTRMINGELVRAKITLRNWFLRVEE